MESSGSTEEPAGPAFSDQLGHSWLNHEVHGLIGGATGGPEGRAAFKEHGCLEAQLHTA